MSQTALQLRIAQRSDSSSNVRIHGPALATISDFFGKAWRGWWLYFVAPLLAMPAAAFLYKGTARRVYCAKLFHYNHRRCIFRCEFPALLAEERTRGQSPSETR